MPDWFSTSSPWLRTLFVLLGALLVYLAWRVVVVRRLQRLAAATSNDLDDRLIAFIRQFFGLAVLFGAIVWVLRIHGISVSPLLAGAGIAGIAIGLAAKETLADVLAGVFLISDQPMRVGDRVKIEHIGREWGGWGDVVDIGLRRTRIRNTDGVIVNYPNAVLANSVVTNFSFESEPVRVRVRFQVGYDADLAVAERIALASADKPGVVPDTWQVVIRSIWDDDRGHAAAGVLLELRYRITDVRQRTAIRSLVLAELLAGLREAGVPLPRLALRMEED